MEIVVNDVKFVPKSRFKVKEVKAIDQLLVTTKGADEDTLELLCALCDVTGDPKSVDMGEFYEDDIFAIIKSYTNYKKKLMQGLEAN